MVIHIYLSF